ncbi:MAG: DNA polymerase IV [Clostridia bacterium]
MESVICHIDCNNAFLSWEAAARLSRGCTHDLRQVPAVVGGDPQKRKGIVLSASDSAKKAGIHTGMSVFEAGGKLPGLRIVPPDYELYMACSDSLVELLSGVTPLVERYSIDECFIDASGCSQSGHVLADNLRKAIFARLGFTVNIGVSDSKLLAKMASGFQKPDKTHVLYRKDIREVLWPLPVSSLFMVGMKTCIRLYRLGYRTIGQVAMEDPGVLRQHFKLFGTLLWAYANGIDESKVSGCTEKAKGLGNSTTTPEDIRRMEEGYPYVRSLCENLARNIRRMNLRAMTISVGVKSCDFKFHSHQVKLSLPTDDTRMVYETAKMLYNELWKGVPLRHISIRLHDFSPGSVRQLGFFDSSPDSRRKLDVCMDGIREKYGDAALTPASLMGLGIDPVHQPRHPDYPRIQSNIFNGE